MRYMDLAACIRRTLDKEEFLLAFSLLFCLGIDITIFPEFDSAFFYFRQARNLEPDNIIYSTQIVLSLFGIGLFEESQRLSTKLLTYDPLNLNIRMLYAKSLDYIGEDKEAKEQWLKMIELDQNHVFANKELIYNAIYSDNNISEAKRLFQLLERINPNANERVKAWILAGEGKGEEALNTYKGTRLFTLLNMKKEAIIYIDSIYQDVTYSAFFS